MGKRKELRRESDDGKGERKKTDVAQDLVNDIFNIYDLECDELYVHVVMWRMMVLLNSLKTWSTQAMIERGNSIEKSQNIND